MDSMTHGADDYICSRKEFSEKLEPGTLAVISSGRPVQCSLDADYPFYPDNNFYYLTGLTEPDTLYAVFKNGAGETVEYLFLPEPEPEGQNDLIPGLKMPTPKEPVTISREDY